MILLVGPESDDVAAIVEANTSEVTFDHLATAEPQLSTVLDVVDTRDVELVVVGAGLDREITRALIASLVDERPLLTVVAHVAPELTEVREAITAGATGVVTADMTEAEVIETLMSVRARTARRNVVRLPAPSEPIEESRVITTFSSRGGVGRTFVSIALARMLNAQCPGEVVLVDLNLQSGDIAPTLGLAPPVSIASVAGRVDRLHSADLKAVLVKDEVGLHVLAAPDKLSAAVGVTPELVSVVVAGLSEAFRYVVIDTPSDISEVSLAALDETSDVVFVAAPDVPSVRALARATEAFVDLKVGGARQHLVLNKASDRYGMPVRDIESVSGMVPAAEIPASKEVVMALNVGAPFGEAMPSRGLVAKALQPLIEEMAPAAAAPPRRRWLLGARR